MNDLSEALIFIAYYLITKRHTRDKFSDSETRNACFDNVYMTVVKTKSNLIPLCVFIHEIQFFLNLSFIIHFVVHRGNRFETIC